MDGPALGPSAAGRGSTFAATGPTRVEHRALDALVDPERVFARFYRGRPAFWLDSSSAAPGAARFSFMGASDGPLGHQLRYAVHDGCVERWSGGAVAATPASIFDVLRGALGEPPSGSEALPFDFCGGYVGYFGYELKAHTGGASAHRSPFPDALFHACDRFLAFDHLAQRTYAVVVTSAATRSVQLGWMHTIADQLSAMAQPAHAPLAADARGTDGGQQPPARWDRDRETYLRNVGTCLHEIALGESYELCLTNQLRVAAPVCTWSTYRRLRRQNPAPYAGLLVFDDVSVACASPERFLTIDRARWVESKPIKGTRPRGRDAAHDRALAAELQQSEKDRAENLMIVDLVRNDLGRTCEIGSVGVPQLMQVESYATLHQLVSTIRGRVRQDMHPVDVIMAAFPGGSMTGAPKARTMSILDRVEGRARGPYAGSMGYLSLNQTVDLNIVIRSAVIGDRETSIGAGGAVVALSDPDNEYEEMVHKTRPTLAALTLR